MTIQDQILNVTKRFKDLELIGLIGLLIDPETGRLKADAAQATPLMDLELFAIDEYSRSQKMLRGYTANGTEYEICAQCIFPMDQTLTVYFVEVRDARGGYGLHLVIVDYLDPANPVGRVANWVGYQQTSTYCDTRNLLIMALDDFWA